MLYELLFTVPPFEDDDTYLTCKRILQSEPAYPALPDQNGAGPAGGNGQGTGLSDECRDLIGKMLEKDPPQRVGLEEVLHHSWFKKWGRWE